IPHRPLSLPGSDSRCRSSISVCSSSARPTSTSASLILVLVLPLPLPFDAACGGLARKVGGGGCSASQPWVSTGIAATPRVLRKSRRKNGSHELVILGYSA